ncbi:hypothetical protein fh0823_08810 [Francisella halioticida]|uniref:Uncharacterized protein n=1 Tax=Francisella halioticida TaxID=549298 RepID=A0ABM6LYY0_9GAMM|nr:hypothetical protein CDV26_04835 [Francisella halioticida]BCD90742.1 hypothetical protein fh0823_08810 [Francisella halioticida]
MTKKYFSIIAILFYSTSFANIYESNNNGVPTFSNVNTKGARQVNIQKPEIVNSYNQLSNTPSVDGYKQGNNEIVWKNQRSSSRDEEKSGRVTRKLCKRL